MTESAPLQKRMISPSDRRRMTDIRFRVLLNSSTLRGVQVSTFPKTEIVTSVGDFERNANPTSRAQETSAASSGDSALYITLFCSLPIESVVVELE